MELICVGDVRPYHHVTYKTDNSNNHVGSYGPCTADNIWSDWAPAPKIPIGSHKRQRKPQREPLADFAEQNCEMNSLGSPSREFAVENSEYVFRHWEFSPLKPHPERSWPLLLLFEYLEKRREEESGIVRRAAAALREE